MSVSFFKILVLVYMDMLVSAEVMYGSGYNKIGY